MSISVDLTSSMPRIVSELDLGFSSRIHQRVLAWSVRYAPHVLRLSFGILFVWLGLLKVLPGVSPAEPLMHASMPSVVNIDYFIRFASVWEIVVGIGFLSGRFPRVTLLMTFATMVTTLSIPWMAPGVVWTEFPFRLTFEGEYVAKDMVIVSSAMVLAAALLRRPVEAELPAAKAEPSDGTSSTSASNAPSSTGQAGTALGCCGRRTRSCSSGSGR